MGELRSSFFVLLMKRLQQVSLPQDFGACFFIYFSSSSISTICQRSSIASLLSNLEYDKNQFRE
jgi:hypothetical protein